MTCDLAASDLATSKACSLSSGYRCLASWKLGQLSHIL